ncbi:hypothetical protein BH23BAC1_BH23BAC1_08570 [soil metagenome]
MKRREFVKKAGAIAAFSNIQFPKSNFLMKNTLKNIKVVHTDSDFEREVLTRPFGFKGGYLTELWQAVAKIESESGKTGIGLGTQSVLYGDADLFTNYSESGGNALLYGLSDKALQIVKETSFQTPVDLVEKILPEVQQAGIGMTGKKDLNLNFIYNALICVDNAAWLLYAAENDLKSFDAMIPAPYKEALAVKNDKIAIMYQVSYGLPVEDIKRAAEQGYFVIKIKAGHPGTQKEMVEKDMARLTEIHNALKDIRTDQTSNGKLIYTLDPNGRYEKKETLMRYVDHAKKIGAFDQFLLIEEPLTETNEENVSDVGIRITADESVHDEKDAIRRLDQGYEGMVLKGIAKTLSLSMKIARLAHERNVPCFCADLTVNPILIDWNKNLAARLGPFPGLGMGMGMMETNGDVNYRDWPRMVGYHPSGKASWTQPRKGVFELNQEYYDRSGGIFEPLAHYEKMFKS